jgi:membrane associated rhomboid family serine protease
MAFFQDGAARQPFLRVPAAVIWLIAALIGAHALRVFAFPQEADAIVLTYGLVPARYAHLTAQAFHPVLALGLALPFVTYLFVHGSFTHVLINSVWLLAFGAIVARRLGTLLFLAFFLVCGIAGALVQLACNWGSPAPVVGASAAISGLMAAGFRMLPVPVTGERGHLAPIFSPRVLVWSAVWAIVNVVAGVTGLGTGSQMQLIAWQAHLGGYAAGLLLAGPFDRLVRGRAPPLA